MFVFDNENELRDYLTDNFDRYFGFNYLGNELRVSNTGHRVDMAGEDSDNIYLIELKRDAVTVKNILQIMDYVKLYHPDTNKGIVGIMAAPKVDSEVLTIIKDMPNIITMEIPGVKYAHDGKTKLRNRSYISSTLRNDLYKELVGVSKETGIQFSKLLDRVLESYFNKIKNKVRTNN